MACSADMADGDGAEKYVISLLERAGFTAWKNPARDRATMLLFDIGFSGGGEISTAEVKFDRMECKTGNVAVEYWNVRQGKPSGLKATEADLWVFVLQNPRSAWACRTSDLRDYFENRKCVRDIACGGDDNAAMRLYRRDELFDAIFARIDDLPPTEAAATINRLRGHRDQFAPLAA